MVISELEGNNQYPPMAGLPALREQISAKLFSYYAVHADAETEVTVTPGATEAIFCAITACVHPGDEVVVFDNLSGRMCRVSSATTLWRNLDA